MPELPEVETVRRGLEKLLVGKKIKKVFFSYPQMIKTDKKQFTQAIIDQPIIAVKRRGKYLLIDFGDNVIISHLRMEGKYFSFTDKVPKNKHFHAFFELSDGSTLVYQDVRKFGTMALYAKTELYHYFEARKMGPEPIESEFKLAPFKKALSKSSRPIKSYLLDQTLVVGLGNIYVDEVLFATKIHPKTVSSQLTTHQVKKLRQAIIDLLAFAVSKRGSTIRTYQNTLGESGEMQDFLKVYGRQGLPCFNCQTPIEKIKLGGRGTHFCPSCQKR
ncbi:DNA-formamidopyrimidine glycosylase [Streptococcus pacificus]|uniref:Formamidopyrimidine-DNA glycosylase n=1 Tax=Streptococcus pacificus TaxID=2740577 RepID=A0ABS0ZI72_9STRE|nr:DNA-formamidopyrimidine glycosylase [Streptococcus pacificus]MBJ8325700.1 DNA-formamidopyrimidine glycosylase [Streptococcus pacificus]